MPYIKKPQQIQAGMRGSDHRVNLSSVATGSEKPAADCDWYDSQPLYTSIDVPESQDVPTGILDADGNEFYRTPNPIGFIWY